MAAGEHSHEGMWVFPAPEGVTRDMAEKTAAMPKAIARALVVTGILFGLGIAGFVVRALEDGFSAHGPWGYYAAIFMFLFMVTGAAPLAAVALRFTKSPLEKAPVAGL